MTKPKERALIILGAGASIEYGVPATVKFTDIIEAAVMSDPWVQNQQGDVAYQTIKRRLKRYLHNPGIVFTSSKSITARTNSYICNGPIKVRSTSFVQSWFRF